MGKSKKIRNGAKKNLYAKRAEQKTAKKGLIKVGLFKVGTKIAKKIVEKPAKNIGKILSDYLQKKSEEKSKKEEILMLRRTEIDEYAEKNSCSRKIARKRISQERRGYQRKSA